MGSDEEKYISQADYARKYGVSPAAVCKAVKEGRLRTNGKKGRYLLVDGSADLQGRGNDLGLGFSGDVDSNGFKNIALPEVPPEAAENAVFSGDLNDVKRRKLEAEILVLTDRLSATRRKLLDEFAQGVVGAFADSFGDLRSELLRLSLPMEKANALALTFEKCLKRFSEKVLNIEDKI